MNRFYLHDEPQPSEFFAQGRVNQILNDSGETEQANYQVRRFTAEAGLSSFRSGSWGTGSEVNAASVWYDYGPGNGCIECKDTTKYKQLQHLTYGYFPFVGGAYMTDSAYALSTDSSMMGPSDNSHCGDSTRHSDHNFDIYDFGKYTPHFGDQWTSALVADDLVYLNRLTTSPDYWMPNFFMEGGLKRPRWRDNDTAWYYPRGTLEDSGGYFTSGDRPTPERLSLVSNLALLAGAKALFYWRDNMIQSDDADHVEFWAGFTDLTGGHDSDFTRPFESADTNFPMFFKRNTMWAREYNRNLIENLAPLYKANWIGAFIRRGTDTAAVDTQTIGLNPLVAPAGDSMTRRMLTRWVPDNNDSIDSNITEVKLPDYMRYMAYGFFSDTSVNMPPSTYFLSSLSMVLDPRNLRCEFVKDADAAINHKYIMRGDRIVWTQMHLDSATATTWRVHELATPSWDTVIAFNGRIKQYYNPAEMKVYHLIPACDNSFAGITTFTADKVIPQPCIYTAIGQTSRDTPTVLVPQPDSTRTISVYGELDLGLKNGGEGYNPAYHTGGDVDSLNITVMSGGKVIVTSGAYARITGNVTVQSGGSFIVDSGAIVRFDSNLIVQDGGSFVEQPGADVRLGNNTYTCAGTYYFKGVASGTFVPAYLKMYEAASPPNLTIKYPGMLKIEAGAAASLNVSIRIDTGGRWDFKDNSVTTLFSGKTYSDDGALIIEGTSSHNARVKCDSDYAQISIGGQFTDSKPQTSSGYIRFGDIDSVSIRATHTKGFGIQRSTFHAMRGVTCLEIDENAAASVDSCVFSNNDSAGISTAIAVYDNVLINTSKMDISHTTFRKFGSGISTDGSICHVWRDTIWHCGRGVRIEGSLSMSQFQTFDSNTFVGSGYSGGVGFYGTNYGFELHGANPYLFRNNISSCDIGVVSYGASFATLACNNIHSNAVGVYSQFDGDDIHMEGVAWQSNSAAVNTVVHNDSANIFMTTPVGIELDNGHNDLNEVGLTLGKLITDVGSGGAGTYTGYLARHNYWGVTNPIAKCGGGWATSAWIFDTVDNTPYGTCKATASAPSSGGTDSNCLPWAAAYALADTADSCDYLTKRYNKQIYCGPCDSAAITIKQMITTCDPRSSQGLREHLAKLLASTLVCTGRDCTPLHALDEWVMNYVAEADSAWQIHIGMWMHAVILGTMQNFDSAGVVFDIIRIGNWPAPEDSAAAHFFRDRMIHLSGVEGSTTSCWGAGWSKPVVYFDRGRAGMQPAAENPIFLEISPNPTTSIANVAFNIPVDDANEVAEVKVFNILGSDVTTLMEETRPAARYHLLFNGAMLPAGHYVVAVHTKSHMQSKLIVVQK